MSDTRLFAAKYGMRYADIMDPAELAKTRIVSYPDDRIVYHTSNAEAAAEIRTQGFRTGRELDRNERRGAIYFADRDVNAGLYARNDREYEPYYGQATVLIPVNIKGLRLLNLTEEARRPGASYTDPGEFVLHKAYNAAVTRGDLHSIPLFAEGRIDGTIKYLKDGRIYEVCLPRSVANQIVHH